MGYDDRSWPIFKCLKCLPLVCPVGTDASQVQKLGWNGCTGLDSQCHAELDFWNDNLRSLNGARIRVEGTVKDLDARDLVSDAGDMLVGVTEFKGGVEDVSKRMQQPLV